MPLLPSALAVVYHHGGKADVSLQERQKLVDDSINGVNETMKRWQQRFTLGNPNFSKRFLSRKQAVIAHLWSGVDSTKLWATEFVHENVGEAHLRDPVSVAHDNLSDREKQAVLAGVVKLTEEPERVVTTPVRLQRVHGFYSLRPNAPYAGSFGVFVSGFTLANRKLASGEQLLGRSRIAGQGELVD